MTTPTQLAVELQDIIFDADPVEATLCGFHERDARLPKISTPSEQALRSRYDEVRIRAMAVNTTHSDLQDRLTLAVIVQQAEAMIDRIDARSAEYGITSAFFAPVAGLLMQLAQIPVADVEQGRAFVARLAGIPVFVAAAADRHREGVAAGRTPVRHLVDATVEYLDHYVTQLDLDPLFTPELHSAGLESQRRRVLRDEVHPALRAYRDVLAAEIAPHARPGERPGLCWLPEGAEIYRLLIRAHTTTDHTPRELHDTGLAIIESLRREYAEIGARAFAVTDPVEVVRRLRSDPSLHWHNADEVLESARTAVERAEAVVPEWFGLAAPEPCAIEPVPGVANPSGPMAYYIAPSLDGSRPGTYFINTDRVEERSRHTADALAFHEGVPGHHFQLSLAQQREDLPVLRRLAVITAYTEGWGLYAERLADEMGLYSGDLSRLGMVDQDSVRAARLVVDTGLHEYGWSRQQAIDFMVANTTLPHLEVETEVDRYIVYPGQALAYMVGRLKIERLRDETRRRLGDAFDIRSFHDTVLSHGSLPLSTLEHLLSEVL